MSRFLIFIIVEILILFAEVAFSCAGFAEATLVRATIAIEAVASVATILEVGLPASLLAAFITTVTTFEATLTAIALKVLPLAPCFFSFLQIVAMEGERADVTLLIGLLFF